MSATRTGMRPRQLDFNKQLNIVRSIEELDSPDINNTCSPGDISTPLGETGATGISNNNSGNSSCNNNANGQVSIIATSKSAHHTLLSSPHTNQFSLDQFELQKQSNNLLTASPVTPSTGTAKPPTATSTPPLNIQVSKKKSKNIPIPHVKELANYEREHLPLYHPPDTYVKAILVPGDPVFVEYDLESQDEEWLNRYNRGTFKDKLSEYMFEEIMWRLEWMCADATEKSLAACGTGFMERNTAAELSTTEHLDKEAAVQYLAETMSIRQKIIMDVMKYWDGKRKKASKPLMRRFQAATPSSDTNPFNVFRPRDKVHRPQTRRRRENNEESLEKLKMIQQNLQEATKLVEMVQKREELKKQILAVEMDQIVLRVKLHHEPKKMHESIEKLALNSNDPKGQRAFAEMGEQSGFDEIKENRLKRKRGVVGRLEAVAELGDPPANNIPVPWELELDLEKDDMPDTIRKEVNKRIGTCKGIVFQFGRGGWPSIRLKENVSDMLQESVSKPESEYWLPIYGEKFKKMGLLIKDAAEMKQEQESSQIVGCS